MSVGSRESASGHDPVLLAIVEGLSRRAAQQQGEARRVMEERVEALMARWTASAACNAQQPNDESPTNACAPEEHHDGPNAIAGLSALVDRLGRSSTQSPAPVVAAAKRPPPPSRAEATSPRPLKSVAAFKGTWSRLRAEQRLRQVLAQVPAMAGPLNSAHVVNRALQAMRELSPQYLDAFILHVDALLWLEQSSGGGEPLARAPAPSDTKQRPTRKA